MPTGKTGETVKERLWFYSFGKKSQCKKRDFICFIFNLVQAVHRRVTEIGAVLREKLVHRRIKASKHGPKAALVGALGLLPKSALSVNLRHLPRRTGLLVDA
jgi:hypothetical protein